MSTSYPPHDFEDTTDLQREEFLTIATDCVAQLWVKFGGARMTEKDKSVLKLVLMDEFDDRILAKK